MKIFFALFLSLPLVLSAADKIYLKTGEVIEVKVRGENDKIIRYQDLDTTATVEVDVGEVDYVMRDDADASYKSGFRYMRAGNFAEAQKSFSRARSRSDNDKDGWVYKYSSYYLGVCTSQKKDLTEGSAKKLLSYFESQKELNRKTRFASQCDYYIGMLHLRLKDFKSAEKKFKSLLSSDRADIRTLSRRGMIELATAEKKYDNVLRVCGASFKDKQFDPYVLKMFTEVMIDHKKDYEKAEKTAISLSKHIRHGAPRFQVLVLQACAEANLGKYDLALEHFLMADLLYKDNTKLSDRSNFLMAKSLKNLMAKKPSDYPAWEYQRALSDFVKKLNAQYKKQYDNLKL